MKLFYPQGSVLTSMVLELKTITGNLHQSYHSYSFRIQNKVAVEEVEKHQQLLNTATQVKLLC